MFPWKAAGFFCSMLGIFCQWTALAARDRGSESCPSIQRAHEVNSKSRSPSDVVFFPGEPPPQWNRNIFLPKENLAFLREMLNCCRLIRDLNPRIKSWGGEVRAQLEKLHNEQALTARHTTGGSRGRHESV